MAIRAPAELIICHIRLFKRFQSDDFCHNQDFYLWYWTPESNAEPNPGAVINSIHHYLTTSPSRCNPN